jgi:hypothetical protein
MFGTPEFLAAALWPRRSPPSWSTAYAWILTTWWQSPDAGRTVPAPAALMTWESERAVVKLRVTGEPSGTHNEDRGQGEWYRSTTPSR